jgi:hypothetical protein
MYQSLITIADEEYHPLRYDSVVVWYETSYVSEEFIASIFSVEE